jgi:cell fate regulator YaaT (PSP1 superfamily)
MCCLVFEHNAYREAKPGAPRTNRAVETEKGPGVVTEVDLLRRLVRVYLVWL